MIALAVACCLLCSLYLYLTRTFQHWKKKGVKHDKPWPLLGNWATVLFAKQSQTKYLEKLYWKYPEEKVVGYYRSSRPDLLIRDPDIIRLMWTTDFQYFTGRRLDDESQEYENIEVLRRNLANVEGDLWKLLHQNMSPAFTSGKLRAMFPLIVERAERLQQRARSVSTGGRPVDARDLMARYTMDFIGACGFGIDSDALKDEDSTFRKLGLDIFKDGYNQKLISMFRTLFPYTFRKLKYLGKVENVFCDLVAAIIKKRNYKPSGRNDFIDLMLEMREKGKIECDSMEKLKPDGTPERVSIDIDDELIAAQVFVFFVGGYESSSSSTSYTLHELAYNPKVQEKVQAEVDRVLAKHNKLTYDAVNEMQYLQWTFMEGLRISPSAGVLLRMCRQKYTVQELGLTLDVNTRISVSAQALHHDPKYWDRPEEFRPERFSPESNEPRHKFAYIPFGYGPRACIGERLAMVQSLAGLAAILSQFSVAPAPASLRRPKNDPTANLVQGAVGGLPLIFTPRT